MAGCGEAGNLISRLFGALPEAVGTQFYLEMTFGFSIFVTAPAAFLAILPQLRLMS